MAVRRRAFLPRSRLSVASCDSSVTKRTCSFFFFQAEDGIRYLYVTRVQTCALPIFRLLALKRGDVIATGGGLPCCEGRLEALRAIGTVVWLAGDFNTLYERARRGGD